MIPDFDDRGYLPAGLHTASLDAIGQRFGTQSEIRRVQMQSIRWLVDAANRAGVRRIVINGSFATDTIEPNDVDCLLMIDQNFPEDAGAEQELEEGYPFIELHFVDQSGFSFFVSRFFATDRERRTKGMIEVVP